MRIPTLAVATLALTLTLTPGCVEVDPERARSAWLVDALVSDNLVWLSREPELLELKYAVMAADPYDFMRGTAGVFFADVQRPGTQRLSTSLLTETGASEVLLVGDPHPENLGSFRPGPGPGPTEEDPPEAWFEGVVIDFNDLDGSHFGPYLLDLRRAAVGLTALTWPMETCPARCAEGLVVELAQAYSDELERLSDPGAPRAAPSPLNPGLVVFDVLEEAAEEGAERRRLVRNTMPDKQGERFFLTDDALDEEGNGMLPLSREERAQVERLAAAYAEVAPEGFRLLDAVRRYGSGVASRPAIRYAWVYDYGQPSDVDDQLLIVREVVDPPLIPGLQSSSPGLFESQAARIEGAPALLWADPNADVAQRGLLDGDMCFKAVSWDSWFQGFDHENIADDWEDDDIQLADLLDLSRTLGASLAAAHARGPTASGADPLDALLADVRSGDLAGELLRLSRGDAARSLADYALFLEALDEHGPLLGAERMR